MAYLTTAKKAEIAKKYRGGKYNPDLLLDEVALALVADIAAQDSADLVVQTITAPDAADTTGVLNAAALEVGAQAGFTTGLTSPDVPRCVVAVTDAGQTGTVTVDGTNIDDEVITEDIVLNEATPVIGTLAFKTITSVDLPAWNADGDAVSIGLTDKLGLSKDLSGDSILMTIVGGVYETTRPTAVVDVDEVEKNVADPNTACDGAKDVTFVFIEI